MSDVAAISQADIGSRGPARATHELPRLGGRRLGWVCGGLVLAMAAWACWPLRPTATQGALQPSSPSPKPPLPVKSVDLAAYRAPIWVVPPPPPPPPTPPPPPPPLKLQLVAITEGEGTADHVALVYDPDQDKLLKLRAGDSIGGRKVQTVTSQRVHIGDASGERILSLKADDRGGRP